jgi:Zn-finger nucleic acid-binding protein
MVRLTAHARHANLPVLGATIHRRTSVQCPKCKGEMAVKTYGRKISINQCGECHGLFTKPDVLAEMKKEWMSEVLDMGDRETGKKYDALGDIDCPSCGARMDKVSDKRQSHIWYESCPNCEGIFLDAGEFTDLKHDTLLDRLRDMVKGRRK